MSVDVVVIVVAVYHEVAIVCRGRDESLGAVTWIGRHDMAGTGRTLIFI